MYANAVVYCYKTKNFITVNGGTALGQSIVQPFQIAVNNQFVITRVVTVCVVVQPELFGFVEWGGTFCFSVFTFPNQLVLFYYLVDVNLVFRYLSVEVVDILVAHFLDYGVEIIAVEFNLVVFEFSLNRLFCNVDFLGLNFVE